MTNLIKNKKIHKNNSTFACGCRNIRNNVCTPRKCGKR